MRRSFFYFLLAALLVVGAYRYYHLTNPRAGRSASGRYTPAEGPAVDLKDVQVLAALDAEYSRLIDAVVPAVVSITSSRTVRFQRPIDPLEFFFPNARSRQPLERQQSSLGSGVIVSHEGHILTNNHVIANMEKIEVQLTDGRTEPAQLIGSDALTDLAVLKIEAKNIVPLPFGDSDAVRVGQMVFAIGNPFGLQETVTQGIVSAKGRRAVADSGVEFLQTDAAVNQGNSGGPLLNLHGEIVGINSAIYSNSDSGAWLGISFAIPANTARRVMDGLLKSGRVIRGYIGVQMSNLTREAARALNVPDTAGAVVVEVGPGSPAEQAGLKAGDVIRTFNGRAIPDVAALRGRIADLDIGAKVELGVLRGGKPETLDMTIAQTPEDAAAARLPQNLAAPGQSAPRKPEDMHPLAAVQAAEIPQSLRDSLPSDVQGVAIAQIPAGSPLADKLRVGDVIEELNRRPLRSVAEFQAAAQSLRRDERALLLISRGRLRAFIVVP